MKLKKNKIVSEGTFMGKNKVYKSVDLGDVIFPDGNVIESIVLNQVYIDSINVTNCKKLKELAISPQSRSIRKLNVTQNNDLRKLYITSSNLNKLDFSKNKKLTYLVCSDNKLKLLNLKSNKKLTYLDCSWNRLSNLNLQNNRRLAYIDCSDNSFKALNLSNNKKLKYFTCSGTKLKSINLTKNTKLKKVDCKYNKTLKKIYIRKSMKSLKVIKAKGIKVVKLR